GGRQHHRASVYRLRRAAAAAGRDHHHPDRCTLAANNAGHDAVLGAGRRVRAGRPVHGDPGTEGAGLVNVEMGFEAIAEVEIVKDPEAWAAALADDTEGDD